MESPAAGPRAEPDGRRLPMWGWLLFAALCLVRLPAVVQPLGPDQGIYAYVGQTIIEGGLPYRDAWDQKPPGLHAFYAVMWWLWPNEAVVPLTDALLSWLVAMLLWRIAPSFSTSRAAGPLAAGLFLLLGDPALARLAGVRVRGQGEVFIGALVTLALWCMLRAVGTSHRGERFASALAAASGLSLGLGAIRQVPGRDLRRALAGRRRPVRRCTRRAGSSGATGLLECRRIPDARGHHRHGIRRRRGAAGTVGRDRRVQRPVRR